MNKMPYTHALNWSHKKRISSVNFLDKTSGKRAVSRTRSEDVYQLSVQEKNKEEK